MPGWVVELHSQYGSGPRNRAVEARADSAGRYEFLHLAPGRYQVVVYSWDGTRREGYLSVTCLLIAGQDRELVLQAAGSAKITGHVTGDEVLPPGLRVTLMSPHNSKDASPESTPLLWQVALVHNGEFIFPAVEPGRYSLLIDEWDREGKFSLSASELVTLEEGETVEVTLRLKRSSR